MTRPDLTSDPTGLDGPAYAFGLRAAVLAIRARGGDVPSRHDLDILIWAGVSGAPGNADAVAMVRDFLADVGAAPVAAGSALLTRLQRWRGGAMAVEVDRLLRMLQVLSPPRLSSGHVLQWVEDATGVPTWKLTGRGKGRAVAYPRFFACAMMRAHLRAGPLGREPMSLPMIGRVLNRDHTSILHALRAWDRLSGEDWAQAWARTFDARLGAYRLEETEARAVVAERARFMADRQGVTDGAV